MCGREIDWDPCEEGELKEVDKILLVDTLNEFEEIIGSYNIFLERIDCIWDYFSEDIGKINKKGLLNLCAKNRKTFEKFKKRLAKL